MSNLTVYQAAELLRRYDQFIYYNEVDQVGTVDPITYVRDDGDKIIHFAAFRGDLEAVRWLIDAGEDVNVQGDMCQTPAHNAATRMHRKVLDFLVSRGADPTLRNEFGLTFEENWGV